MIKKKVLDTFSLLWKIAIPLISAVIGLKLVEQFNVLQALSIITDEDRAFDICTSVYFAIINVMLLSAAEWIKNTFFPAQSIQVIFSKPGDIVQNNAMPDLLLREASPCEARVTVMINAKKKNCKGLKITIECISFATMQLPAANVAANVDENGNYIIDLEKLFGNQEQADTSQTFRILFSKEPTNGVCQSVLYSKLSSEPWKLTFNTHKMIVRTEG